MAVPGDFSFPKLTPSTTSTTTTNRNDNKSPASHLTLSSASLWRISSLVYPDDDEYKQANDDHGAVVSRKNDAKSFSDTERDHRDSEERMDALWEDFNEQETMVQPLQRASSLDNRKRKPTGSSSRYINYYYPSRSDDIVFDVFDHEHRYLDRTAGFTGSDHDHDHHGLKLKVPERRDNNIDSSSSTTISTNLAGHRRRTSMVVLLRAFRKLFLLHNLARNKKN
ncbi:hypothetical protein PanWU01x14_131990 [Parasponia andersonii]|uniref:Uncharacterized protein n=1 Tax=Parasponia andersonii TaxID=3476 RepID=A0A2P5CQG5_PARAD|nr:hypothetical protein PanWU01x14_131990 [Parasponia andersonii]